MKDGMEGLMTESRMRKIQRRALRKQQVTQFKEIGQTYFYYLRDDKNMIFGGVALKKNGDVWCRGITLWAEGMDTFDRKECRRQAMKRLTHAYFSEKDDFRINISLKTVAPQKYRSSGIKLRKFYPSFFVDDDGFKSRWNAHLTEKEQEIVKDEEMAR